MTSYSVIQSACTTQFTDLHFVHKFKQIIPCVILTNPFPVQPPHPHAYDSKYTMGQPPVNRRRNFATTSTCVHMLYDPIRHYIVLPAIAFSLSLTISTLVADSSKRLFSQW